MRGVEVVEVVAVRIVGKVLAAQSRNAGGDGQAFKDFGGGDEDVAVVHGSISSRGSGSQDNGGGGGGGQGGAQWILY